MAASSGLCKHGSLRNFCGGCALEERERVYTAHRRTAPSSDAGSSEVRDSPSSPLRQVRVRLPRSDDGLSPPYSPPPAPPQPAPHSPSIRPPYGGVDGRDAYHPVPGQVRLPRQQAPTARNFPFVPKPPGYGELPYPAPSPSVSKELLQAREMLRVAGFDPTLRAGSPQEAAELANLVLATAPRTGGVTLREFNERIKADEEHRKAALRHRSGPPKGLDGGKKKKKKKKKKGDDDVDDDTVSSGSTSLPPTDDVMSEAPAASAIDLPEAAPLDPHSHDHDEDVYFHHAGVLAGERVLVPVHEGGYTADETRHYKEGMPALQKHGPLSHVRLPKNARHYVPPCIAVETKGDHFVTAQLKPEPYEGCITFQFPKLPRPPAPEPKKKKDTNTPDGEGDASPDEAPEEPKKKKKKKKKPAGENPDEADDPEAAAAAAAKEEEKAAAAAAAKPAKKPGGKKGKKKAAAEDAAKAGSETFKLGGETMRLARVDAHCPCGKRACELYDVGPPIWLCANCGNRGMKDRTCLTQEDSMWGCSTADSCKWGLCEGCHNIPLKRHGHPVWRSRKHALYATEDQYWRVGPLGEEMDGRIPIDAPGNEPEVRTTVEIELHLDSEGLPQSLESTYPYYEIHPTKMRPIAVYGVVGVSRRVDVEPGDDVDQLIYDNFCKEAVMEFTFSMTNTYGVCFCGGAVRYHEHLDVMHDRGHTHCDACRTLVTRPHFSMCDRCTYVVCRNCRERPDFTKLLEVDIEGDHGLAGMFLLEQTTLIAAVESRSPAARQEIIKGMQVTHVGGVAVHSDEEVMRFYMDEREKEQLTVNVIFAEFESVVMTSTETISAENGNLHPYKAPEGSWKLYGHDPHPACAVTAVSVDYSGAAGVVDITTVPEEGSPAGKENTLIKLPNDEFDIDALFANFDEHGFASGGGGGGGGGDGSKKKRKKKEAAPVADDYPPSPPESESMGPLAAAAGGQPPPPPPPPKKEMPPAAPAAEEGATPVEPTTGEGEGVAKKEASKPKPKKKKTNPDGDTASTKKAEAPAAEDKPQKPVEEV